MRAIPERFCSDVPSLRGAMSSACMTFTFTFFYLSQSVGSVLHYNTMRYMSPGGSTTIRTSIHSAVLHSARSWQTDILTLTDWQTHHATGSSVAIVRTSSVTYHSQHEARTIPITNQRQSSTLQRKRHMERPAGQRSQSLRVPSGECD